MAKVADALNELYERLSRMGEVTESRAKLSGSAEDDLRAMREEVSKMSERVTRIEEALISLVEQLAALDYLNDLVEKIYVKLFKDGAHEAT